MNKVTIGAIFACLTAGIQPVAFSQGKNSFYMKIFSLLTLNMLFFFAVIAQNSEPRKYCGATEAEKKFFAEHPQLVPLINEERAKLENHTRTYFNKEKSLKSGTVYIIPVVFHILHDYGSENISDAQIFDAMRILNEDFRKKNADSVQTIAIFKSIAWDAEIEFRLARIDPNGNCTDGIDRIWTMETYIGDDYSKLNQWPRNKYLNIWVAKTLSNGAAGYSYAPANTVAFPSIDGVMILHDYVGSIGTGYSGTDGALSHEVGHWINLQHPWGNNNDVGQVCGDDLVNDTPETKGWISCNLNGSICNPPIIENVQNFMDYSYCETMFTKDQTTRMRAALTSSTAGRNNLWTTSNLIATGTNTGYVPPLCVPIADFFAATEVTCANSSILFTDVSYNGSATSRSWTFSGGDPSTATDSMPFITYYNPGKYTVTLTVSNDSGSNTKTKTSYITVLPSPLKTMPYQEGFESAVIPGTEWTIINDDNGKTWGLVTTAGYASANSLKMNNYGYTSGNMDEIISPTIDMSVISSGATISFKVAYVQRSATSADILRLLVSNDCGKTWAPRWSKTGANLATAAVQSTAFTPSDTSKWKAWTGITVSSAYYIGSFRFKFEFTSGGGNNLYIDDINITGTFNKIPVLVSPPNFSTGQLTSSLTLDWNAVSGVDSYEMQVDTLMDFSSPWLINASYAYLSFADSNSDTRHVLTNLYGLREYYWHARTVTTGAPSNWSSTWRFATDTAVLVQEKITPAIGLSVYPNPLQRNSVLVFSNSVAGTVAIDVMDVLGKRTVMQDEKYLSAGSRIFNMPALNNSGIYIVRVIVSGDMFTQKVLLE